ncbi:hypothetical protein GPROT2_03662 [Gammaproteobacteria bacterium]|nr:hypothetical protein GPROT2_03662 [Gammaproteobacteria bacterium]
MTAIEILRNEHHVILEAMDLLEHQVHDIRRGDPFDAGFARWAVEFVSEFIDDAHHAKEEGVLFGLLAGHGLAQDRPPLADMLADHRRHRELAADMERSSARGDGLAFAAATLSLVELLRRHVLTENELVFNVAERLLTPADDAEAVRAFGRVVQERDGALVRQRHLAAIECWRRALEGSLPPGA